MEIIVLRYKDFKEKVRLTKQYSDCHIQNLGDGILMISRYIELN